MPTGANKQWISDKLIGIQVFVPLGKYDLQKTIGQSEEGPRLGSRDLHSGPFSVTDLPWGLE